MGKHIRSRTTSHRCPRGTSIPGLSGARGPTSPIDGDGGPRSGRGTRARRVGVASLTPARGETERVARPAVSVLRAARGLPGTGVPLVGAGQEDSAGQIGGDDAHGSVLELRRVRVRDNYGREHDGGKEE